MNIGAIQNVNLALQGVWEHRFRSLLTILGIVIGITTVVTVASLLTGLRQGVVTFFQEMGPDNIFLYKTSGDPNQDGPPKERKRRPMKPEYAEQIRRWCTSVADVGLQLFIPPVVSGKPITARVSGFESESINVAGQSPNMIDISPRDFASGRYFTAEEDQRSAHVAVIGSNVADSLFPVGEAVGRGMMMDGAEYTIIGVYAKAKGGFFGENGQDNAIVIPLRTAEVRYPQVDRFMITAKAKVGKRQDAYDEVQGTMRRIRHLATDAKNDFAISTPDQIIQQFDRITGLIGLVAIAISALGLLVGGIGVMNIMLVSVTERTREIGLRKAIGARPQDILIQFILEAIAISLTGGLIGLALGASIVLLVTLSGVLTASVDASSVALALGFSMAVGLFFGIYPAQRAARLNPIDALRFE